MNMRDTRDCCIDGERCDSDGAARHRDGLRLPLQVSPTRSRGQTSPVQQARVIHIIARHPDTPDRRQSTFTCHGSTKDLPKTRRL